MTNSPLARFRVSSISTRARKPPPSASAPSSATATSIASTHRGHGHCIAKGCDVTGMMKEIFGRRDGLCGGKGGSMHIADLVQGHDGRERHRRRRPAAHLRRGADREVSQDGRRRGRLRRRRRLQSGHDARILQSRQGLAIAGDLRRRGQRLRRGDRQLMVGRRQPARPRRRASACRAIEVDGFDFFAVYDVAREAIERAREGGGPSLIHARLYRYYGHFEGDAMTYRAARGSRSKCGRRRTALKTFRKRVTSAGLLESKDLDAVDAEVAKLIDEAVAAAEAAPRADRGRSRDRRLRELLREILPCRRNPIAKPSERRSQARCGAIRA